MLYKDITTKTTDVRKKIINNDAIGKPVRQVCKASLWQRATIEITQRGHSIIAYSLHFYST